MSIVPATGNSVQSFTFNGFDLRVINQGGDPWFVAKDVASILDLSDVSMMCLKLRAKDKGTSKVCTLGGDQLLTIISESALYRVTLRSNKPQAEPFQDWVCDEVLPTIRKTGKFVAHPEFEDDLFESAKQELKAAQAELMQVKAQIAKAKTFKLKAALVSSMSISDLDLLPKVASFCAGKTKVSTTEILQYLDPDSGKFTAFQHHAIFECLKQLNYHKNGKRHRIFRRQVYSWIPTI